MASDSSNECWPLIATRQRTGAIWRWAAGGERGGSATAAHTWQTTLCPCPSASRGSARTQKQPSGWRWQPSSGAVCGPSDGACGDAQDSWGITVGSGLSQQGDRMGGDWWHRGGLEEHRDGGGGWLGGNAGAGHYSDRPTEGREGFRLQIYRPSEGLGINAKMCSGLILRVFGLPFVKVTQVAGCLKDSQLLQEEERLQASLFEARNELHISVNWACNQQRGSEPPPAASLSLSTDELW